MFPGVIPAPLYDHSELFHRSLLRIVGVGVGVGLGVGVRVGASWCICVGVQVCTVQVLGTLGVGVATGYSSFDESSSSASKMTRYGIRNDDGLISRATLQY